MAWFHRNGLQALQEMKFYDRKSQDLSNSATQRASLFPTQEVVFCMGRWDADKSLVRVACTDLVKYQSSMDAEKA